jgi:glycosyltransferase involved in cell wall biosynthesis
MRKKKILFQSDYSLAKTGFGRNAKAILSYLYKTGKYDIVHYCCGINWSNPELTRTPWKSVGALPDNQQEMENLRRDPNLERLASYGAHYLDKIIEEEKPDIYIAVQDIWGVDFAIEKPWFNKINSIIWTTLDSLPILPSAIEKAEKIKNYWIWSNFATKALHKLGHKHVKTVHGAVDSSDFRKLTGKEKKALRVKNDIPEDAFVIGFVFRNQLRKSVPNLLEGYKLWKKKNPNTKSRLLLHTHFGEGWNIHRLADEHGIDKKEIITTHICRACKSYEVKPFDGQDKDCGVCKSEKSVVTTQVSAGVTEPQLNEVYNLMDVYCHPFTSGGQEIPIQEAKLVELITLVTDYSCGEEMCEPEAYSLALEWNEYREHGTEFIKASTCPKSICKELNKVFKMNPDYRKKMGEKARKWAVDNFSSESVGGLIEKEIDSLDFAEYNFSFKEEPKNPHAEIPQTEDDSEWLVAIYDKILRMGVNPEDDGHKYWMQELSKGIGREDIEKYFRKVASENENKVEVKFEDLLDKEDEDKRILYVMPESIGDVFLSTSLFKSIKELYPDYNLYVSTKPENFEVLDGNKYIHKTIPYTQQMDNLLWLEGQGSHKGYFEIAFLPFSSTQRFLTYLHNGKDKIAYNINYATSS